MRSLDQERRLDRLGVRRRANLRFEQLEDRCLFAIAITLTGTQVAFVGDESGYQIELSVDEAGRLQHNVVDESLNSSVDLDATQAGDQTLMASEATLISIDLAAAGGGASITGIDSGHLLFVGGSLRFDWQAFSRASTTTFIENGFTRVSGSSSLTASVSGPTELGLVYGDGADTIQASAFTAGAINATTHGGDDTVIGTDQNDVIFAGAGNDFLDGRGGDDSLSGDEQFVSAGNDIIYAGAGDDFLYGGLGDDQLYGGDGVDNALEELATGTFVASTRRLNVDGFVVRDHGIESFSVNGSQGDDFIDVALVVGSCVIYGLAGDDIIIGSNQADWLDGGEGNDSISGRDGNDEVYGGLGDDVIQGGDGDDWLFGNEGNDDLSGNAGRDTVRGGEADDRLEGNAGDDDLDGEAGSDTVLGGAGNDVLSEDPDPTGLGDSLHGGDGDDLLQVFGGVNTLRGDGGNDTIDAGLYGIDDIHGGSGNDTIAASLSDTFAGGAGVDTLAITSGLLNARITNNSITLDGVTRSRAGIEDFSLFANNSAVFDAGGYTAGSVAFRGSAADDVLIGSENADFLLGGGGRDSLYGNGGKDVLRADIDDATVLGGAGIDDFGFYYLNDPESLTRAQILDVLLSRGIIHDIANNEPLAALIS